MGNTRIKHSRVLIPMYRSYLQTTKTNLNTKSISCQETWRIESNVQTDTQEDFCRRKLQPNTLQKRFQRPQPPSSGSLPAAALKWLASLNHSFSLPRISAHVRQWQRRSGWSDSCTRLHVSLKVIWPAWPSGSAFSFLFIFLIFTYSFIHLAMSGLSCRPGDLHWAGRSHSLLWTGSRAYGLLVAMHWLSCSVATGI